MGKKTSSQNTSIKTYENDEKDIINGIIFDDVKIVGKTNSQKRFLENFKDKDINFFLGGAGFGKTYVTIGFSLKLLKQKSSPFTKLILLKSLTQIKGQEVGFLKGTLEEKMEPYLESYNLNIDKIVGVRARKNLYINDIIRTMPISFVRGSGYDNAIILVDEVQNFTLDNLKTIITRLGENSKIVFMGDPKQIDLKNKRDSCVHYLEEIFGDQSYVNYIICDESEPNQRNPLINEIEKAFQRFKQSEDIRQMICD